MAELCGCIDNNCDECFELSVAYCPDQLINISAGLTPAASLYLWIRDKFGNLWYDTITVNADGSFDIDTDNFTTGMFTPTFGALDIFLSTDDKGANIVPMTFNLIADNCLILSVGEPVYLTDDTGCIILTDDEGKPLIAQ